MREVQQRHAFAAWSSHQPFGSQPELRARVSPHIYMEAEAGDDLRVQCVRLGRDSEQAARVLSLPVPLSTAALREALLACVTEASVLFAPPYVIGVGLGGSLPEVGFLAQKALMRPIGKPHQELEYARIEQELLDAVNGLGLGPGGWGGETTALSVQLMTAPTHADIAPVCIYLQTPCMRAGERVL